MTKLNDTQLMLLSAAAQRADRAIVFPDASPEAERHRIAKALLGKGVTEEVPAKGRMPVNRIDAEGGGLSLVISDAGLTAIGVTDEAAPDRKGDRHHGKGRTTTNTKVSTQPRRKGRPDARSPHVAPASGKVRIDRMPGVAAAKTGRASAAPVSTGPDAEAPREGSKLASVIALLARADGARLEELTAATGWLPHTARAALTGLRRRGYTLARESGESGGSVYRIVRAQAA